MRCPAFPSAVVASLFVLLLGSELSGQALAGERQGEAVAETTIAAASSAQSPVLIDGWWVVELTLQPAALPTPALKYRLLPSILEQKPGDAAAYYMKALILFSPAVESCDDNTEVTMWDWLDTPVHELPKEDVKASLARFEGALQEVKYGSRRAHAQWALPLEESNFFSILLPEVQETRRIARVLLLRSRLHMAEGRFSEAVDDLQACYAMGRHVGEQPLLISGLVGLAICGMANQQVQGMMELPGSPNLYWALTNLPTPLIDIRPSLELESKSVYLLFPMLAPEKRRGYSNEEAQVAMAALLSKWREMAPMFDDQEASGVDSLLGGAALLGKLMLELPRAKADLVESGFDSKEVEAMAPAKVLLLHIGETFDRLGDEMFKWSSLPLWQSNEGLAKAERELQSARTQEIVPLASLLLPALHAAKRASARADREVAALRCLEALRAYAAEHDGKLPASLDEITDLPIPLNPVTGQPFPYRLEGEKAILDAGGEGVPHKWRYFVRIAKPAGKEE